jgi:hypothetical protein
LWIKENAASKFSGRIQVHRLTPQRWQAYDPRCEFCLRVFLQAWRDKQPKLVAWVEENIPEGFAVFDLPESYLRKLRTSNACENLNSQIKRRTRVVGLFPGEES